MTDKILEPEGSFRIITEKHGIPAGVTLYFVFDGDWANVYDDLPADETEARSWFTYEVQKALEAASSETRDGDQTERPSDTENRGA